MSEPLTLKIYTVERQLPDTPCDYVLLPVADSSKGEFSGSYGIKKGHCETCFALGKGSLKAYSQGEQVLSLDTESGFARVADNIISVTLI